MAFDNNFTAVTGATYTAAQYNTHTRDNFTAIWVYTTAGDIAYASSASALARLALTVGGLLMGGASAPEYLANVANGVLMGGASAPAYVLGSAYTFMKSNGSAASFGSLIAGRQGGSATNWQTAGATSYTPTTSLLQVGSKSVNFSTGVGSAGVGYPIAFTERPVIFLTADDNGAGFIVTHSDDTTTQFTLRVNNISNGTGTVVVNWMAIGA